MSEHHDYIGTEVAIIGVACRYSGSANVEEFWYNLKNGKKGIKHFTDEDLLNAGETKEMLNSENYVKAGSILEDKDCFDANFFGYTPREAEVMDPQMRVFHEVVWEALEDSGYLASDKTLQVGLYGSSARSFNWRIRTLLSGKYKILGNWATEFFSEKDLLCTKVSYKLDLTGPSIMIATECSSSLVATHLASRALLMGDCDIALAGGVQITMQKKGYKYTPGMIHSPDGYCRAFDKDAQGTVSGEGAGVIVLKRLSEAINDNDNIYAVIRSTAINNDGTRKVGYTAPSVLGQQEVIRKALDLANIPSESISYVEAHGTGTPLGDPIEIEALKLAFDTNKRHYCGLGSVKTNIGHLDAGAGLAGLIKVALSLKNKQIPPSLNFKEANPKIDFKNSPFYVNTKLQEWKKDKYPLRASVSSFGAGGTNGYAILEEFPIKEKLKIKKGGYLLPLSAKSKKALFRSLEYLTDYLINDNSEHIEDIAYTLQVGRESFQYKQAITCTNKEDAINKLQQALEQKNCVINETRNHQKIIFMFPGQGAQYINMGIGLYKSQEIFRKELDYCFEIVKRLADKDLLTYLFPVTADEIGEEAINQTSNTQVLIFSIEYALAKLLMSWGIVPDGLIGHSIGEYVAATLSGVFSLEDAIKLIYNRGELMQALPKGAMLSINASEDQLKPYLNSRLSIAALNGTFYSVIAGDTEKINELSGILEKEGIANSVLKTSHAFHSYMMSPMLEEYERILKQVQYHKPNIPFVSSSTGSWVVAEEVTTPEYWLNQIKETVRFNDGINTLNKLEEPFFIEVGPGNTLSTFVRKNKTKEQTDYKIINTLRHPKEMVDDYFFLLNSVGKMWLQGGKINWAKYYNEEKPKRVSLPKYPFEKVKYWIDDIEMTSDLFNKKVSFNEKEIENWFYIPKWKQEVLSGNVNEETENRTIALFVDDLSIGEKVAKQLECYNFKILFVRKGEKFSAEENNYYIDPNDSSHYIQLFEEFSSNKLDLSQIVYLWSLSNDLKEDYNLSEINLQFENSLYYLISLVQTFAKVNIENDIRLSIITNNSYSINGEEIVHLGNSLLPAALKTISKEYSNFKCSCYDINLCQKNIENTLKALSKELINNTGDFNIALRGKSKWNFELENIKIVRNNDVSTNFKDNGVYIITGGTGGIGFEIAKYIGIKTKSNIILLGRSEFIDKALWDKWLLEHSEDDSTSEKIKALKEIEKKGGKCFVFSVDVSNEGQVKGLAELVKSEYGRLNGIIHTAGIIDSGIVQVRNKEMFNEAFKAKVKGTVLLNDIFKDLIQDFYLLFSSTNSIFTPFGQIGYNCANAFMDNFASVNNNHYDYNTISINWDSWLEIGMASRVAKSNNYKFEFGIMNSEGMEAIEYILENPISQIAVIKRDVEELTKQSKKTVDNFEFNCNNKSDKPLSAIEKESQESLQVIIPNMIKEHLGIKELNVNDNFFEIGLTSLDIIQINNRISTQTVVRIPFVMWYEYPTVKSLLDKLNLNGEEEENDMEVEMDSGVVSKLSILKQKAKGGQL